MLVRESLCWIHEHLVNQYGVSPALGYMHTLRGAIAAVPPDMEVSSKIWGNSLKDVLAKLEVIDEKTC